jgi:hypothetical protein
MELQSGPILIIGKEIRNLNKIYRLIKVKKGQYLMKIKSRKK